MQGDVGVRCARRHAFAAAAPSIDCNVTLECVSVRALQGDFGVRRTPCEACWQAFAAAQGMFQTAHTVTVIVCMLCRAVFGKGRCPFKL